MASQPPRPTAAGEAAAAAEAAALALADLSRRLDELRRRIATRAEVDPDHRLNAILALARILAPVDPDALTLLRGRRVAIPVTGGAVLVDLGDWTSIALLAERAWERPLAELCMKLVAPGQTVLDVGAHTGVYTTLFCSLVGPRGRVIAFEPLPANRDLLARTILLNGHEEIAQVEAAALADVAEPATAPLFAYAPPPRAAPRFAGPSSMLHSLVPAEGYTAAGAVTVAVTSLDRWAHDHALASVDLIKIDTEGAELQILRGARALLDRSPAVKLLIELHPIELAAQGATVLDVADLLETLGMTVHEVEDDRGARLRARRPGAPIAGSYVVAARDLSTLPRTG